MAPSTNPSEEPVRPYPSISTPMSHRTDSLQERELTFADMEDCIDKNTFEQILEMDDDDDKEFSRGIVFGFFDQAKSTFDKMEAAL
jgi:osomolarity two-component system phosphorelay intermediate protein YPD1